MKLLIVDDEIIIRTGISQVIDWKALGIEILSPAASAEEALERIAEELPQIILTDIRMGAMSGLDLANRLKQDYPQIEVIILSGYNEFAYAQQAIREGVGDYLLKTSRPEDIIRTIIKAKQRIQDRLLEEKRGALRQRTFRKQLLEQLITEGTTNEALIMQATQQLRLEPPLYGSFQLMLITASGWEDHQLLYFSIENILKELFLCDTIARADSLIVLIRHELQFMQVHKIRAQISNIEQLMKCSIFAGLGSRVSHYTEWTKSYQEACQALSYRFIAGGQGTMLYDDIQSRKGGRTVCSREEESELASILYKGNHAELLLWIRHKIAEQIQDVDVTPHSLRAYLQSILISGYRWLERVHPSETAINTGNYMDSFDLLKYENPEEVLYKICCSIIEQFHASNPEHQRHSYIPRAMAYIREHLHMNLTLQQVAKQIHVNPNHFSEIFKKETGMTYIEFITRERMVRAMEIIKQSDIKISLVAKLVGYEDVKYFSQLFKKHAGQTPSEFREKN